MVLASKELFVPMITQLVGFGTAKFSSEAPSCNFFLWKYNEMKEEYYKDQIRKMRYEICRKEDYSEVVKAHKKVVQLEKARDELQELREDEKEVFEIDLMELNC
ncbi:unnamed protein product [Lactuca virosa]|uniref:Uncharacterized protein n=1 Tax=Lactuca virosa TaxID=75947 RepID=A0AAU9NZI7_9ASTR|nr:unnamed protein product [Lactuca virosa]